MTIYFHNGGFFIMKITKQYLKQVIKEEMQRFIKENSQLTPEIIEKNADNALKELMQYKISNRLENSLAKGNLNYASFTEALNDAAGNLFTVKNNGISSYSRGPLQKVFFSLPSITSFFKLNPTQEQVISLANNISTRWNNIETQFAKK